MTINAPLDTVLQALRTSAERLQRLVTALQPDQLEGPAYPTEWTVAEVLSHLGSAAVITQRRIDDDLAGRSMPDDFSSSVWDEWNAKSPAAKVHDAPAVGEALIKRIEATSDDERSRFRVSFGPVEVDLVELTGLRLNEHALHTWDVEVIGNPAATLTADAAEIIVDNLELIGRFTAKPTGSDRTITVHTISPSRWFTIVLTPDTANFGTGDADRVPDIEMSAEAFSRLVYGRLDAQHTPEFEGDPGALDELRRVFPGP
jgi:uncharacterized protein (TIGR03083 family)